MKKPTMEEILTLVEFERSDDGQLCVRSVRGDVLGNVCGAIGGNVEGTVNGSVTGLVLGKIAGWEWKFYEDQNQ